MGLPCMLIGSLAVALWGAPRSTLDVDLSVWDCRPLPDHTNPLAFARRTRVLPVETSSGLRTDIVFAPLSSSSAR